MPESNVRTTRPLNLTSDVVLRPRGPLDACISELEGAVSYVADRVGGTIVLDCTDLTLPTDGGVTAITALLDRTKMRNRAARLRHVPADLQHVLDRLAASDDGEPADTSA